MRIHFVLELTDTSVYHRDTAVGGVCYSICSNLADCGFEVWVNGFLFDREKYIKSLSSYKKKSSVKIFLRPILKLGIVKKFIQLYKDKEVVKKLSIITHACKESPRPDLIISWIGRNADIGSQLKKQFNAPLLSIYDNPLEEEFYKLHGFHPFRSSFTRRKERNMISDSDKVVIYCQEMFDYLKSKLHLNFNYEIKQFTDDSLMLEQGADVRDKDNSTINLVYVGSFLPWHNIDQLVIITERINKNSDKNIQLHLVGYGMEYEKIHELVFKERLDSFVKFYGFMNGPELKDLLKNMDIGIIPGCLWFHAPVKYFQYTSAGLIILAPSTPVLSNLSKNAEFVALFENSDQLKEKILKVIDSPEYIKRGKIKSLQAYREKYSSEAYRNYWKNLLQEFARD